MLHKGSTASVEEPAAFSEPGSMWWSETQELMSPKDKLCVWNALLVKLLSPALLLECSQQYCATLPPDRQQQMSKSMSNWGNRTCKSGVELGSGGQGRCHMMACRGVIRRAPRGQTTASGDRKRGGGGGVGRGMQGDCIWAGEGGAGVEGGRVKQHRYLKCRSNMPLVLVLHLQARTMTSAPS